MSESVLGENLGVLSQIGTGNEQEGTGNMISLIRRVRHVWREHQEYGVLEPFQVLLRCSILTVGSESNMRLKTSIF